MIDYKTFDKESPEIFEEIKKLLFNRPHTRKEIYEFINASISRINEQMSRLSKHGWVVKRKIKGNWYYGIRNERRLNTEKPPIKEKQC